MYKLLISNKAVGELKRLKREYKQAVMEAFEEIQEDPLVGKPLTRELSGRFSYRMGVFRIIYKVSKQDGIVWIITAGHRATIYN